jgi:hypothetical protein
VGAVARAVHAGGGTDGGIDGGVLGVRITEWYELAARAMNVHIMAFVVLLCCEDR